MAVLELEKKIFSRKVKFFLVPRCSLLAVERGSLDNNECFGP